MLTTPAEDRLRGGLSFAVIVFGAAWYARTRATNHDSGTTSAPTAAARCKRSSKPQTAIKHSGTDLWSFSFGSFAHNHLTQRN